jgi:hypothetical protein
MKPRPDEIWPKKIVWNAMLSDQTTPPPTITGTITEFCSMLVLEREIEAHD